MSADPYKNIRPYNDDEVRPVLEQLVNNPELLHTVIHYRYPRLALVLGWLLKPLLRWFVTRHIKSVNSVHDFQLLIEVYMTKMIKATTHSVTTSGMTALDVDQPYLYMSNHRDIAMDPALLNYVMYQGGHETLRVAIGDNLLTKDYASDIMRLNKSFIVNRSAVGPRKILAAYKQLSAYILESLNKDRSGIWIAQREGRAKDGLDKTMPAIIKMLTMSFDRKNDVYADFVRQLHLVPVAISYEYDPCDVDKARALYITAEQGGYQKAEQEDIESIAVSINGDKGNVHIAFGVPLQGDYETPEQVAAEVDRQVIKNYVLHPSNFFAFHALHGVYPKAAFGLSQKLFNADKLAAEAKQFARRLDSIPTEYRSYFLHNYANCIQQKIDMGFIPNPLV